MDHQRSRVHYHVRASASKWRSRVRLLGRNNGEEARFDGALERRLGGLNLSLIVSLEGLLWIVNRVGLHRGARDAALRYKVVLVDQRDAAILAEDVIVE